MFNIKQDYFKHVRFSLRKWWKSRSQWKDYTTAPTITTFELKQKHSFYSLYIHQAPQQHHPQFASGGPLGKLNFVITVVESTVMFWLIWKPQMVFSLLFHSLASFFWSFSGMETWLPFCCQWSIIAQGSFSITAAFPLDMMYICSVVNNRPHVLKLEIIIKYTNMK